MFLISLYLNMSNFLYYKHYIFILILVFVLVGDFSVYYVYVSFFVNFLVHFLGFKNLILTEELKHSFHKAVLRKTYFYMLSKNNKFPSNYSTRTMV